MFPSAALLTTLFLVLSVTAKPLVISDKIAKLSLQRHLNVTSTSNLIHHDRARAIHFRTRGHDLEAGSTTLKQRAGVNHGSTTIVTSLVELPASTTESNTSTSTSTSSAPGPIATDFDQPIENGFAGYVANISIGDPPTTYTLVVDTGSSNTWIGGVTPYTPTNTSVDTGERVSVTFGFGSSFSGKEYLDQVTLADGLVLTNQSIGVADTINNFDGADGILGLGPVALTRRTLSPSSNETVPTVTDNAFSSGLIPNNQIGIYFEPATTKVELMNGELTWGGVDEKRFTGDLNFAPITTTSPSSLFWGIDQNVTYGESTTILDTNAGVISAVNILVYLATDAYDRYVNATGAKIDSSVGLLTITSSQLDSLKSLFFNINGVSYEFTPNAQIWPRSLNSIIGGKANSIYLVMANLGRKSGSGLDFILGYAFLERFYTVYDTANKQIGFATTYFTNATSN